MNVLEKILEEILQYRKDNNVLAGKQVMAIEEIIRSHMDDLSRENNQEITRSPRDNGGWIPIEDRVPEESLNSVLGWDVYRERCVFVQLLNGRWIFGNDIEPVLIKAWQPLPEPYRPEKGVEV